mmetsp:Transcript_20506/g.34989  ORF Transcript_20506/g.34989 Transcript_20506/m.34989 type:complete len:252 (-) Transcript_20506:132-887(-)
MDPPDTFGYFMSAFDMEASLFIQDVLDQRGVEDIHLLAPKEADDFLDLLLSMHFERVGDAVLIDLFHFWLERGPGVTGEHPARTVDGEERGASDLPTRRPPSSSAAAAEPPPPNERETLHGDRGPRRSKRLAAAPCGGSKSSLVTAVEGHTAASVRAGGALPAVAARAERAPPKNGSSDRERVSTCGVDASERGAKRAQSGPETNQRSPKLLRRQASSAAPSLPTMLNDPSAGKRGLKKRRHLKSGPVLGE